MKKNMYYFRITIQSFDFYYIKKTRKEIFNILHFFQVQERKINTISIPVTKQKYTVERSPHIDKKSREQFEIRRYKTALSFTAINQISTQMIYSILKNFIFPGVQLTISIEFKNYLI